MFGVKLFNSYDFRSEIYCTLQYFFTLWCFFLFCILELDSIIFLGYSSEFNLLCLRNRKAIVVWVQQEGVNMMTKFSFWVNFSFKYQSAVYSGSYHFAVVED